MQILLVAGSPGYARLLRAAIRHVGVAPVELTHAVRVGTALDRLRRQHFDLIVLDLVRPDGRGLESFSLVQRAARGTPIVVLSDRDDEELALQSLRAGAWDDQVKGAVDAEALARVLRSAAGRNRPDAALRRGEGFFLSLVEHARDVVVTVLEADGTVRYHSPSLEWVLGYRPEELTQLCSIAVVHPDDLRRLSETLQRLVLGPSSRQAVEFRIRHKNGFWRTLEAVFTNLLDDPDVSGIVVSSRDVSERKLAEPALRPNDEPDGLRDALTGLPNRALFVERLALSLQRTKRRNDYRFAVLLVDLDRFKNVNDSLGHQVGDQLLIAVTQRLTVCLRPDDTVARLGGDEFAILLEDLNDASDATRVAERVQRELSAPFDLDGRDLFTSASIGIALSANGYERPEDLLRDADIAMYRAKATGREQYAIFDQAMHARAVALLQLEADLRRAVERRELEVHYQPIVTLASGQIVGAEALLRWYHPRRGLLSPAEFIPVAEETGVIVPIGAWLIETVCAELATWQAMIRTPFTVSVNLSARQLQSAQLLDVIRTALQTNGLSPHSFEVEITESTAVRDLELSQQTLRDLSALGILVAVDDFGVGYGSFEYLRRFPVNRLKIDQSFVRDLRPDSSEAAIVGAVIALAHGLGMSVVAEGVETEEEKRLLQARGCDAMQGFLFSRPVPAKGFVHLLQAAMRSPDASGRWPRPLLPALEAC